MFGIDDMAAAALLGSGLSAILGIGNSVSNKNAQREANATNLQIARETNDTNIKNTQATNDTILAHGRATNDANIKIAERANEANYRLAQLDRDFQLAQWKRENEYNSPAAQAARFRAAGINPALASGDAGKAGSLNLRTSDPVVTPQLSNPASGITAPTASATATMVAPQSNLDLNISGILQAMSMYEDVKSKHIENKFADKTFGSRADKEAFDAETSKDTWNLLHNTLDDRMKEQHQNLRIAIARANQEERADEIGRDMKEWNKAQIRWTVNNLKKQWELTDENYKTQQIINRYKDQFEKWSTQEKQYAAALIKSEAEFYTSNQFANWAGMLLKAWKH